VNTNNYELDDGSIDIETEQIGAVGVRVANLSTNKWICDFLTKQLMNGEDIGGIKDVGDITVKNLKEIANIVKKSKKVNQTPMMKVIDYHVRIVAKTGRLKQLNLGLDISDETELRKERLPFRGVVDILRTVDDTPRFPSALNYSVVRALKDENGWSRQKDGAPLNPIILSEKPWIQCKEGAYSYLLSFTVDLFMHWFKIWSTLVLVGIIFLKK